MSTSDKDVNVRRRQYLRYALAGASLLAVDVRAGAPCTLCVRSPWGYYHLNGVLAAGGNRLADYGNEHLPSLRTLNADEGQWAAGSWIGDGVGRGLEIDWLSDPLGLDAVASVGFGAMLIGVAVRHPRTMSSSETVLNIGQRSGSGAGFVSNGLELKINRQGRASVSLSDDAGAAVVATVNAPGVFAAGSDVGTLALFVHVDNRPDGARSLALHQYELGTTNRVSKVKSIAALGAVTGGSDGADKALTVGHRNTSGYTSGHYRGFIRGLHMLNFGRRPPTDVDYVMDQLSLRGMVPAGFLEGL